MIIKNLYLKIVTKTIKATEKQINQLIDYKKKEKRPDDFETYDFNGGELEEINEEVIKDSTILREQLIKIQGKFNKLHNFIYNNSEFVNEFGKQMITPQRIFDELLVEINAKKDLDNIAIWFDTNIVFCYILPYNKERIDLALSEQKITQERYDELLKALDYE